MKALLTILGLAIVVTACGSGNGGASDSPSMPGPVQRAIYDVQGNGAASPLVGQAVTLDGVVTGDFQDNDADTRRNLGGFYIQNVPDADLSTSDGVFIFDGNNPATAVAVGDLVRVTGVVNEHFGETQVSASSVSVVGGGAIQPAPITLPLATTTTNSDDETIVDLERYEGMLVRFPQALTVTSLHTLGRYGEVGLSVGRPLQFTNFNPPGVAAYNAYRETLAAQTILLDDGRRDENPSPVTYLTAGPGPGYSIRSGDEVVDLTGTIRFARGSGGQGTETYRVVPTGDVEFIGRNPRGNAPVVAGSLHVVSFNTLNFFSGIDTGQDNCGPAASSSCRGADSAMERDRQLAKLVTTLDALDADIVGLIEIENNGGAALQMIVDALNASSDDNYAAVDTGAIGDDAIATAFIYKTATVSLVGNPVILDSSVDTRFSDVKNRPALAQAFRQVSDDAILSVVVNHLKSKGSPCDDVGDPNRGDGQGNCNATRTRAAEALADWVAVDPTGSGDADYLVIGDLNAYVLEDPLAVLTNAGLTYLAPGFGNVDAYSFAFDGQFGALDHALSSPSLTSQVVGVAEWHINADEAPLRDYNLEFDRDPDLFDPNSPYRTSDHDPLIIGLDLAN